jgi:hypothetical protein
MKNVICRNIGRGGEASGRGGRGFHREQIDQRHGVWLFRSCDFPKVRASYTELAEEDLRRSVVP